MKNRKIPNQSDNNSFDLSKAINFSVVDRIHRKMISIVDNVLDRVEVSLAKNTKYGDRLHDQLMKHLANRYYDELKEIFSKEFYEEMRQDMSGENSS